MDLISQDQFLKLCLLEVNKALTRILKFMDILEKLMLCPQMVERRDLRQDRNIVRLDHNIPKHHLMSVLNSIRNQRLAKTMSPDLMNPFLLPDMAQDLRLADCQLQTAPFLRPNPDRDQFSQLNQINRKNRKFIKRSKNLAITKLTKSV